MIQPDHIQDSAMSDDAVAATPEPRPETVAFLHELAVESSKLERRLAEVERGAARHRSDLMHARTELDRLREAQGSSAFDEAQRVAQVTDALVVLAHHAADEASVIRSRLLDLEFRAESRRLAERLPLRVLSGVESYRHRTFTYEDSVNDSSPLTSRRCERCGHRVPVGRKAFCTRRCYMISRSSDVSDNVQE